MMSVVTELTHPLVRHHLTRLRSKDTSPVEFRLLIQQLTSLLAYAATEHLLTQQHTVETPLCSHTGARLSQRVGLVPILRAGLAMVDPLLSLIPTAEVWHLGVYRDEATAQPVEYYSKLPATNPPDVALVLDPMLATGGSACAALSAVRTWGVPQLSLLSIIGATPGIEAVCSAFPQARVFVCAQDPELNAQKYIVPGLGDAGDRLFNTLPGGH
jgi:uracil phosphoribosyltransferase